MGVDVLSSGDLNMNIINKLAEESARRKVIDGYPVRYDEYGHYIWFEDCIKVYMVINCDVNIEDDRIWVCSSYKNVNLRACSPLAPSMKYVSPPFSRFSIEINISHEFSDIFFGRTSVAFIRFLD